MKKIASIQLMNFDRLVGAEVGTSTLVKELARGGMAVIFVAYQRTLRRQIAVKILPKALLTTVTAEMFQQEAEAAAILSHPNIVTVHEVGETEEFLFIAMQLVKGRSLFDIMRRARRHPVPTKRMIPLDITLDIMMGVLDALDYAHRQDIIHRDVKPGNILIEAHTKRPIISDFGLAITRRSMDPDATILAGSPTYMAPEQVQQVNVDGRADLYSAAVMLFEMLSSYLPLPRYKSAAELLEMKLEMGDRLFQKRPSEINPMLHPDMDKIIQKALSYDPDERYPTCKEFLEDIRGYRDLHLQKSRSRNQ
jgi:serine/threonine-protein kinase